MKLSRLIEPNENDLHIIMSFFLINKQEANILA